MVAHRSYPAAITGSRLARWAWRPRIATSAPGADPGSVRTARDFTVTTRHQRGMAERSPDIAIVVPELMTNALRHALPRVRRYRPRRPIRLGLLQPGPWVLCAVADPGKTAPAPRTLGSSTRPAADCTSSARSATSGAAPRPPPAAWTQLELRAPGDSRRFDARHWAASTIDGEALALTRRIASELAGTRGWNARIVIETGRALAVVLADHAPGDIIAWSGLPPALSKATREVSMTIQRRPHCSATNAVVPDPQVGIAGYRHRAACPPAHGSHHL